MFSLVKVSQVKTEVKGRNRGNLSWGLDHSQDLKKVEGIGGPHWIVVQVRKAGSVAWIIMVSTLAH